MSPAQSGDWAVHVIQQGGPVPPSLLLPLPARLPACLYCYPLASLIRAFAAAPPHAWPPCGRVCDVPARLYLPNLRLWCYPHCMADPLQTRL